MGSERIVGFLALGGDAERQLLSALNLLVRDCRATGRTVDPGLLELRAQMTEAVLDRQRPTSFDTAAELVHDRPVQQALAMSYSETAEMLGISKRTVERMVANGKLVPIRETRVPRIPVTQIRALIERRDSGRGLRQPDRVLRPDASAADR